MVNVCRELVDARRNRFALVHLQLVDQLRIELQLDAGPRRLLVDERGYLRERFG
jgi:hypothetical protein